MAHAGGRPKKPTELKVLQGTYRKDRDAGENQSSDLVLSKTSVIVPEDEKIKTPRTIKTREGKKFYKQVIENLKVMHVLSRVDLAQIETLARYLERIKETDAIIQEIPLEDIDRLTKYSNIYDRLTTRFDNLASKYYISPQSRVQLKLSELNLIRTSQEVEKNQSAISNLLSNRREVD
jgi:hypothetical protein